MYMYFFLSATIGTVAISDHNNPINVFETLVILKDGNNFKRLNFKAVINANKIIIKRTPGVSCGAVTVT